MRTHDEEEAAVLNAEPWMMELIAMNPSYVHWGPHEDYMTGRDSSWRAPLFIDGWAANEIRLDELNEVVSFYFEVGRPAEKCDECGGSGSDFVKRLLSDTFHGHRIGPGMEWVTRCEIAGVATADAMPGWGGNLTEADEKVLADAGRPLEPTVHDCISQWMLVEARVKRLGKWENEGYCQACEGRGHVWTSEHARVDLVLWLLHPRKGASRGVEISGIVQADLPEVFAYLREAAQRNAERFAKVPAKGEAE